MLRYVLLLVFLAAPALADRADRAALEAVNDLREANNRSALAWSGTLETVARKHAEDMARQNYFSHSAPDGSGIGDRALRQGYGYCFIAENIARGQRSLGEVMQSWTDSRGHRKNMLHRKARQMAVARTDGNVWVMVLGAPGC